MRHLQSNQNISVCVYGDDSISNSRVCFSSLPSQNHQVMTKFSMKGRSSRLFLTSSLSCKFAQAHPLQSLSSQAPARERFQACFSLFQKLTCIRDRAHLRSAFFKLTFFGRLAWHMFQVYLRASSDRITEKKQVIDESRKQAFKFSHRQ